MPYTREWFAKKFANELYCGACGEYFWRALVKANRCPDCGRPMRQLKFKDREVARH